LNFRLLGSGTGRWRFFRLKSDRIRADKECADAEAWFLRADPYCSTFRNTASPYACSRSDLFFLDANP